MKFKGTIIITDPCYIMPPEGREMVSFMDYLPAECLSKQLKDYTPEEIQMYNEYKNALEEAKIKYPDYWSNGSIDIFDGGSGLEKFGFTNWIWEDTLFGDWDCTTFELRQESKHKMPSEITERDIIKAPLGEFCADAGLVGVFLLDEVLKFNPEFDYHIKKEWTTTLIKDFDGDIEYITEDDEAFIKGIGNVNFITRQTGF